MLKRKTIAFLTVILMIYSICFFPAANAQEDSGLKVDLSQTRFRFPVLNLEKECFKEGISIDENELANKYLFSDKEFNATGKLFFASVEKYDHLSNGKVNKALRILSDYEKLNGYAKDVKFKFVPVSLSSGENSKETGPLSGKDEIIQNDKDHGIMFHIDFQNIKNDEDSGYQMIIKNSKKEQKQVFNHHQMDIGIALNEHDNVASKGVSNFVTSKNKQITFIWTKDSNVTYDELILDENKNLVFNKEGTLAVKKVSFKRKTGDSEIIIPDEDGRFDLPHGFCGYVLIPFSSVGVLESKNLNGLIDLKVLNYLSLAFLMQNNYNGVIFVDDVCLYGPKFQNVTGSIDMGIFLDNTNFLAKVKIDVKKHDINNDNKITTKDALITFRHIAGVKKLDDETAKKCDINQDGKVNTVDALFYLKAIALVKI